MPSKLLKLALRPFGYTISEHQPYLDLRQRLLRIIEAQGISLMLDVGANRGQFAKGLFKSGYGGKIVSFEPLSDAHAQLLAAAAGNPNWRIFRRCAVGAHEGRAKINIAGNSQSSSLLPMLDRHIRALLSSSYIGVEDTEIVALDHVLSTDLPGEFPVGVKIDVQGYEAQVLQGLRAERPRVGLIYTELSLTPLYQGEAKFISIVEGLLSDGFRCVSLTPNFVDPATYEVLDVNALFVRDSAP